MKPRFRCLLMALLAVCFSTTALRAADIPDELNLVPKDSVGFVHVQLAEIWKSDSMSLYRDIVVKAGARAIQTLDQQFTPAPTSIDRLTAVLFLNEGRIQRSPMEGLSAALIVRFSQPIDAVKIRSIHLPDARVKNVSGKEYFVSKDRPALAFMGEQVVVLGEEAEVVKVLSSQGGGPLQEMLRRTKSGHIRAAINMEAVPLPANALDSIPEDFQPLAQFRFMSLSVELGKEVKTDLRLIYRDANMAQAAERSLKKLADMARVVLNQQRQVLEQQLYKPVKDGSRPLEELPIASAAVAGLGMINYADELLAKPPVEREDTDLTLKVSLPAWMSQHVAVAGVATGLLLPAIQKSREAASRVQAMNNLKQIGLAFHIYHDAHGSLPPAAICDKKGNKLLSWRVALLPYLEQQALYEKFRLDEPWDSEHNKPLANILVKVYTDPRAGAPPGYTYYKSFVGKGAILDPVRGTKFASVTDGLSNTILAVAGGDPVPWTKPEDFDFDPAKPLPPLTKEFGGLLMALYGDGSVRMLQEAVLRKDQDRILKLLIQKGDGNAIPNFD